MASLDVRVLGGAQLYDLGRRLKTADKTLAKELRSGLQRAARPLTRAVRAEIAPTMPKGYEQVLSKSLRMRTEVRTGYTGAVRITATAKGQAKSREIRALDKGVLRHPVFGRYRRTKAGRIANPWVAQAVRPGFWSRPMNAGAPVVRRELVKVMADVADKITRG